MNPENLRQIARFHADLARQTATTSNLAQLLRFIIAKTMGLAGAVSGSIMVHDAATDRLHPYFSTNHPAALRHAGKPAGPGGARAAAPGRPVVHSVPVPADDSVAAKVWRTGRPIIVNDLALADPDLPLRRRAAGGSFLSLPLKLHRRTVGVLNLNRPAGPPGFVAGDLDLLRSILPHIAGLVEKGRLLHQLESKKNEVQTLYQLSRLLFSGAPFAASLRRFMTALADHLGLERVALIRFGNPPATAADGGGNAPDETPDGPGFDLLAGVRLRAPQLRRMLDLVQTRLRADLSRSASTAWDDPHLPAPVALAYREKSRAKAMFVIPLPLQGEGMHALLVSSGQPTVDTELAVQQYRFLHLVSKQLAVAIERETMLTRIQADQATLRENNRQNQVFLEISKELASTLDPTLVLSKAFHQFRNLIAFSSISILMFDELEKTYRLIVQPAALLSLPFQRALRRNVLEIFRDYPADPPLTDPGAVAMEVLHPQRKSKVPLGRFRHVLHLPFILGDRVVGLIHLTRREDPPFTRRELDTTSQFTGIFVTSIKNALIHRRTEKLAFTDPLTSLFNHRYFQETLAQEFVRARRYGKPLSLMILDIDFFKRFNDTYGHLLGDKVLIHCGRLFERSVREKIDTVARYGGEEFAVLLPETPLEGASLFAERIRRTVEETPLQAEVGSLPITLSIGVSCTTVTDCQTTSDLIQAADSALYEAKEGGRNRVTLYRRQEVEHA
ncbi:MAG: GGDEF domain-containing protein [Candidatus Riflebacteria bacterium]|nr:GGDEF domain-containing protein [Candidatus Riflebacteria bacterium]